MAQWVKNLFVIQETQKIQVQSLGWEDTLEQGMATHSCLGNPMNRGAWRATVHGVKRVRHDLVTKQQGTEGSGESGLQVE